MAARLIEKLPNAVLFINNCDAIAYDHIECEKVVLDMPTTDPVKCSNLAFWHMINHAPLDDDLLIIEDDTECIYDIEKELNERAYCIEDEECFEKYTINPLYTPTRNTHYTPIKDEKTTVRIFHFIRQNWVDTNLFIPAALLPEFKEWYKTPPPIAKKSNGIGKYHSVKMYEAGYPMFTCVPSLLGHGAHDSIIYPEGRKRVPLIAKV